MDFCWSAEIPEQPFGCILFWAVLCCLCAFLHCLSSPAFLGKLSQKFCLCLSDLCVFLFNGLVELENLAVGCVWNVTFFSFLLMFLVVCFRLGMAN